MSDRRNARLDVLERQLTGPKRIALFGHRNVGKTTLLAMFYRQASTGQVPGVRLAAADATTAEYLAEKIAQIESGESLAGTLAETELALRLYHGPTRFDLIVKDYQGEHVALGSDEPIHEFFADCDAVLLCLDPEGSANPAERRRRQQEVEQLLERYLEDSEDGTTDRPVALLITKYDQVLDREPGSSAAVAEQVERFAEALYGMTRHALAAHVTRSALFAVSAYGQGSKDGRPPAELHPLGLEGPLGWLADQLEARDQEQLQWLCELAPDDLPRLARCLAALERRYPRAGFVLEFRRQLDALRVRRRRRNWLRAAGAAAAVVIGLATYDFWGYRAAMAFERDHPAPAVARRWADLLTWHPSLGWFWPSQARQAQRQLDRWKVEAARLQVAHGTDDPKLHDTLKHLKDEAPELAPAIAQVEAAEAQRRHDVTWKELQAEAALASDEPEKPLAAVRSFLREFPETPHKAEAVRLVKLLRDQVAARQAKRERLLVEDLARAEALPNADLRDLIDQARRFLADHPDSALRPEVERRLAEYTRKLDDRDIERARQYSRQYPTHFATRIEKYQDYLKAHAGGGRYISEATEAKDRILREWDNYTYRQAYDHFIAHPDDVAEVARRLNAYLAAHPDGQFASDARNYLKWWDKVSSPGEYHVTLRRGEVAPSVGKYLAGGGPDLGVVLEVAGVTYGPSPVVRNTHRPIWDYTFPRPIQWKLGDPITIRIIDYDWSDTIVFTLHSRKGDPLAIRLLSGTIAPSKGGATKLVFASDFQMPKLAKPD
jgi:GTPase SAR1 family protein/outer membrane protein assembly factor BamD (BamD/ComL family)